MGEGPRPEPTTGISVSEDFKNQTAAHGDRRARGRTPLYNRTESNRVAVDGGSIDRLHCREGRPDRVRPPEKGEGERASGRRSGPPRPLSRDVRRHDIAVRRRISAPSRPGPATRRVGRRRLERVAQINQHSDFFPLLLLGRFGRSVRPSVRRCVARLLYVHRDSPGHPLSHTCPRSVPSTTLLSPPCAPWLVSRPRPPPTPRSRSHGHWLCGGHSPPPARPWPPPPAGAAATARSPSPGRRAPARRT